MPVLVESPEERDAVRSRMLSEHGVQTSVLYPALHELSAYRELAGTRPRPRAEWVARAEITLPLYPHMTEGEVERVIEALRDALS
jgi:dTDP-4-amino-4,6-dideoxygalactose transaminase